MTDPKLTALLERIDGMEARLARVPHHKRQLRFSVCMGKGWIEADEPRVELVAELYNLRREIADLIRQSTQL